MRRTLALGATTALLLACTTFGEDKSASTENSDGGDASAPDGTSTTDGSVPADSGSDAADLRCTSTPALDTRWSCLSECINQYTDDYIHAKQTCLCGACPNNCSEWCGSESIGGLECCDVCASDAFSTNRCAVESPGLRTCIDNCPH